MSKRESQVWVLCLRWTPENCEDAEDIEAMRPLWETHLKDLGAKWIYQIEKGDDTGKLHMQGYIRLKEKRRADAVGKLMQESLKGSLHCSPCSEAGKEALRKYCMKSETKIAGPWDERGNMYQYRGEDLPKETELVEWQRDLEELLLEEPDNRDIWWYWSTEGCYGKTMFLKYLSWHHGWPVITYSRACDVKYMCSQNPSKVYLFDLARSKPESLAMNELYNAMEEIKNGLYIVQKYESKRVITCFAHIVVFANFAPCTEMLSKDRWKVITMDSNPKYFPKMKRQETSNVAKRIMFKAALLPAP